jgi:hypothetical protein
VLDPGIEAMYAPAAVAEALYAQLGGVREPFTERWVRPRLQR